MPGKEEKNEPIEPCYKELSESCLTQMEEGFGIFGSISEVMGVCIGSITPLRLGGRTIAGDAGGDLSSVRFEDD